MSNEVTQEKTSVVIPLAIAIVAFVSEGMLGYSLFKGWIGLSMVMIGHAAIILVLSSWPLLVGIRGRDLNFPLLFLMLVMTMGVFGAGICVITMVLYAIYSRNSTSFADWYASLFPEDVGIGKSRLLYERLALGWDDFSEKTDMIPYMDVITLGTEQQRRIALDKITRHFTPELAPVLIKALEDPSNSIRIQAATVLAKLEQGFSQTAAKLEKKIRKSPNNAKTVKLVLQLAKHYDTYAHAGFILDKDREWLLRDKAIKIYERYQELAPKDKEVPFYLGRLYLQNRNIEDAYVLLKSCVEDKENITPAMIWCYMECLYHKRDFEALKHVARTYFSYLNPDDSESFKVVEMVRLWGGGILEPFNKEGVYEQTT